MNNIEIGQKIKDTREELNMSLEDVANLVGVNKSTIQRYEAAKITSIKLPVIQAIAESLNVDPVWLIGKSEVKKPYKRELNIYEIPNIKEVKLHKIPILGDIACGEPIYANEEFEYCIECDNNIKADFALRCVGDSMINSNIHDNDIVLVQKKPVVNNGEIACVLVDDEATLKRVYINTNNIMLVPANPKYPPVIYTENDYENIRILGKAIKIIKDL